MTLLGGGAGCMGTAGMVLRGYSMSGIIKGLKAFDFGAARTERSCYCVGNQTLAAWGQLHQKKQGHN